MSKVEEGEKTAEELELEKLVFGDMEGFDRALDELNLNDSATESESEDESHTDNLADDELFYVDDGNSEVSIEQSDEDMISDEETSSASEVEDAWIDSDDDRLKISLTSSNKLRKLRKTPDSTSCAGREYEKRLRTHFEKLHPRPKWTDLKTKDDEDELLDDSDVEVNPLDELLKQKTNFLSTKASRMLPPGDLDIQRLQDANRQLPSKSAIQSLEFHPTHPLVLTGGYDRTLRIYHVDGKVNPLATSLHIHDSPFQTALFHPDGLRVFAAGRRRFMYIWNLKTGEIEKITRMYGHGQTQMSMEKFVLSPDGLYIGLQGSQGWMNVLSAENGQWVAGAKIDGEIADIVWSSPEEVTIASTAGDIFGWNVNKKQFTYRWKDAGAIGVTTIAQNDRWCAVGASNGMVNIYDRLAPKKGVARDGEPEIWEPNHVIENLVTTVSSMKFSPDGQILAIASRAKRDSLKMVHVPSFSVFKNWPTSSTPLGRVTALAFAPRTQMFCAGNLGGNARLWTLNHFSVESADA